MLSEKKIAIAIVVTYALFLPLGGFLAYHFLNNTKLVYEAPSGSLVAQSEKLAHQHFEDQVGYKPLWVLVQETNASNSIVEDDAFKAYCHYLNASILVGGELFGLLTFVEGYYFVPNVTKLTSQLIGGPNNDSTLLNINIADDENYNTFVDTFQAFNDKWLTANNVSSFSFLFTGVDLISEDLESGILADLAIIDAISMPLAFAALAYCLSSVRLLLVPLMTVPSTLALAFSIMYPVSLVTDVSSFAPEMAAACMMAISIDYALFILSRFVEQCHMQHAKFGQSPEVQWTIIKNTAVLSAHNILISGLTIAVALGGLSFLPISFLSTIGMTMSCGAVSAVVVSMTLMPSALFVFFDFFANSHECETLAAKYRQWRYGESESSTGGDREEQQGLLYGNRRDSSTSPLSATSAGALVSNRFVSAVSPKKPSSPREDDLTAYHLRQYQEQSTSIWFKIGLFAFRHPLITVLAVLIMGVPFFYFAFHLRVDFDLFNQVPRQSDHAKVLKEIVADIGRGSAAPYYLVFIMNDPNMTIWNDARVCSLINNVTNDIHQQTGQPLGEHFLSPCMVEFNDTMTVLNNVSSWLAYLTYDDYKYLFNRTVNRKQNAVLLSFYTTFDPFAWESDDYLNSWRSIISTYQSQADWAFIGMLGASTDSWSIMHHAMDLFPYQIGITFGVIFVFIAIVFRSVFVPLRMVFTVAYTIGMSYGAGVIMFQYKWLHKIWPALDGVNAYTWTVPIFSFSLLSALALDYDVFLLTRILEFKRMGYCDEAAISKAVWKTGRIISFAGVIMFIAFGSLVFSNTTMLNEFGAVAAFAVAIDTFIIRPFFAPALMSIFPKWAWWPRKFKELERTIDDMRGDLGLDENTSIRGSYTESPTRFSALV